MLRSHGLLAASQLCHTLSNHISPDNDDSDAFSLCSWPSSTSRASEPRQQRRILTSMLLSGASDALLLLHSHLNSDRDSDSFDSYEESDYDDWEREREIIRPPPRRLRDRNSRLYRSPSPSLSPSPPPSPCHNAQREYPDNERRASSFERRFFHNCLHYPTKSRKSLEQPVEEEIDMRFNTEDVDREKPRKKGKGVVRTCEVCLNELGSSKFSLPSLKCKHRANICRRCLRCWYITKQQFHSVECLNSNCDQQITVQDASLWIPKRLRAEYIKNIDTILLKRGLIYNRSGRRQNLLYCSNCSNFLIGESGRGNSSIFQCNECLAHTCSLCHSVVHHPIQSHSLECQVLNEQQQERLNIKQCPNCHMAVQKNGGCNHMTCRISAGGCGAEFCWICLADYNGPAGIHAVGNSAHHPSCRYHTY